jgi:hypothetical protein
MLFAGKFMGSRNIPLRNPKPTTKTKGEKFPKLFKPKEPENLTNFVLFNSTCPKLITIKIFPLALSRKFPKLLAKNILLRVQGLQRHRRLKESEEGRKTLSKKFPTRLNEEVSEVIIKIRMKN